MILAEITGVLVRYDVKLANLGYNVVLRNFNLKAESEIFDLVVDICKRTGSRAVDAYFIATAKLMDSILVTNDKIMVSNAKRYGIEAYYLIDQFDLSFEEVVKSLILTSCMIRYFLLTEFLKDQP